jgi:hypothetical protein
MDEMEEMTPGEPQSATEYDDRTTTAVKAVLLEIGQTLGSFKGKFAVIGGAVPWLLLHNEEMPHVGTIDVDIGLAAEALGDGEYATLIEALQQQGYQQQQHLRRFQLVRRVPIQDGGPPIDIVVDFLMPKNAQIEKNKPPLIDNFAVQRADGADLAMEFYQFVAIDGVMPDGIKNRVEIAVCSIPSLLAMKGYAIANRYKRKDAYDIYYCVRNFPGGPSTLAEECKTVLASESGKTGYEHINAKFDSAEGFGPSCVRQFVEESHMLGDRTAEQWQYDAYGQVNAWLLELGLRS